MKHYKPTTPGRRQMTGIDFSLLTKKRPEKSLIVGFSKKAGRNNQGRITVRHHGKGAKRKYRLVDFKQEKHNIPAKVLSLEYDPNRTCFIALIQYTNGEKSYILLPQGLKIGDEIITSEKAPLNPGNRLILKNIPVGAFVYNIELEPGKGGQLVRSAGTYAKILAKEGEYVQLELPSTEIRKIPATCWASLGALSNPEHNLITIGKAGRSRWLGIRPTVRGSAMNPRDHAHGGGEGRALIGRKRPYTPWGKPALGVKTRRAKKKSNVFIIQRRRK